MITPGGKKPRVIESTLGPTVAASATMKSSAGNAIVISVTREISVSIQPRK